ncbi:MAG: hypothetical protein ACLQDV_30495 [Candidatus Binataceae bacterium]
MKSHYTVQLADNERHYDALIKALKRACDKLGPKIGINPSIAFGGKAPAGRKLRPAGTYKIFEGLWDLLQQAIRERSELKDETTTDNPRRKPK